MKLYIAFLLVLFSYQVQADNACYHHPTTCEEVFNCDLGCTAGLSEIVAQFSTMEEVWQVVQLRFGGPWTVVQTESANWYTNAGIAATCTCAGVNIVTIFAQQ
jgi:hypothetical protein